MAMRPVFTNRLDHGTSRVVAHDVEFTWSPGMSLQQKRRCITSLHEEAHRVIDKSMQNADCEAVEILEVSSKSDSDLGVALSAFNLQFQLQNIPSTVSVENAFQCSKVFEKGGPFPELLLGSTRDARHQIKSVDRGRLTNFELEGKTYSTQPLTNFYDWLYIRSLHRCTDLTEQLKNYNTFTDIEFNPKKSINCQASSVALYQALVKNNTIDCAIESPDTLAGVLGNEDSMSGRRITNPDNSQFTLDI